MKSVDLRSDTVTKPSPEMYKAMQNAEIGDDVLGDDPTVKELESVAAKKVGKKAALFVPSGTMGNLIALFAHTTAGQEVILERRSHIFIGEGGGLARLAGLLPKPIVGHKGKVPLEEIKSNIKSIDYQPSETGLICIENTHNQAGGIPLKPDYLKKVESLARKHGIGFHLDGARIFNSSVAQEVDVKKLTGPVDSVMFCLSKGLACPVGSIIAGNEDFIKHARKIRQLLGGGMRQAGILAAAGLVALEEMIERISEDHLNARVLAEGIRDIPYLELDPKEVHTNILFVKPAGKKFTAPELRQTFAKKGIKCLSSFDKTKLRLVTHYGITRKDIEYTLEVLRTQVP